jgi:hypothetical protein
MECFSECFLNASQCLVVAVAVVVVVTRNYTRLKEMRE